MSIPSLNRKLYPIYFAGFSRTSTFQRVCEIMREAGHSKIENNEVVPLSKKQRRLSMLAGGIAAIMFLILFTVFWVMLPGLESWGS